MSYKPFRFIDNPIVKQRRVASKPTLTPVEVTKLRRIQKELQELQWRLESKTTEEWNPTDPDVESMFILCSIESARKNIDLTLEHHEMYRQRPPTMFNWSNFQNSIDQILYEDLFNTVYKSSTIVYPPEDEDEK